MSDPWPPPAPKVKKDFEKTKDESAEKAQAKEQTEIVTKEMLEEMDKLRNKPASELELKPPGTPKKAVDPEFEKRYQKIQERLRKADQGREQFNEKAKDNER